MSVLLSTYNLGSAMVFSQGRSSRQIFLSILISVLLLGTLLSLPVAPPATSFPGVTHGALGDGLIATQSADHSITGTDQSKGERDSGSVPVPGGYQGFFEELKVSESVDELGKIFGFAGRSEHGKLALADARLLPPAVYFDGDFVGDDLLSPQLLKRPPPTN